jgi:enoyl-CoA hydratase/carnithine racemase
MTATDADDLLVDLAEGIATLTLNRPHMRNAVDPAYLRRMIDAVRSLDDDPAVRVIVLRGSGKSFCAGGTLDFLRSLPDMDDAQLRDSVYECFQGITRTLHQCRKPTIVSAQGAVVGAACEMAAACDFRIVSEDAFFLENWVDLGLIPPLGGLFLLPRLVGLGKANEMVMLGERVPAAEAKALGLANRVVPLVALEAETRRFAEGLAAKSANALRVIKQGLRRGQENSIAGEWEFNVHAQLGLIRGPDFQRFVESLDG